MRARAIVREAAAAARSQAVASTLTVLIIASMVLTVMLTTGRTVAAEQEILGSIDDAGTRTIEVRAENAAGITVDVLDRIRHIDGIEWAAAFSSAVDATNALIADGTRVPVRYVYGDGLARLGIPAHSALPGQLAYASPLALDQFGLVDTSGTITLIDGSTVAVAGRIDTPDFLAGLEPVVLVPHPEATGAEIVNVVLVIAETPELVAPVSDAVLSVLAAVDPSKVTVQTSEALATLRGIIESQLGSFSRALVLALLAVTTALVAIILYGLVMMRRRDFGRRRALGATRGFIATLLLTQTALLAAVGVALGLTTAVAVLLALGDPLPGAEFAIGLGILALAAAVIAAVIPAVVASHREPIRELRVP